MRAIKETAKIVQDFVDSLQLTKDEVLSEEQEFYEALDEGIFIGELELKCLSETEEGSMDHVRIDNGYT